MLIYLVRHGETDWNREMKFQGWADIALNARGREEARALAVKLKDVAFDFAFSSDLVRARETAEILLEGRGTPLATDRRLREMNFGPLEGLPYGDARTNPESPVHRLFTEPDRYEPPEGAEPISAVSARFDDFLRSVLEPLSRRAEAGCVLVAAHGVIVRDTLVRYGGHPYRDFWRLPVGNCSASVLELTESGLKVVETGEKTREWLI